MPTAFDAIDRWINEVRAKLENGGIQKGDLDQLHRIIRANLKGTHDNGCSIFTQRHRASGLRSSGWRYTNRWRDR